MDVSQRPGIFIINKKYLKGLALVWFIPEFCNYKTEIG